MFSSPWFLSGHLPNALALDTSSTCLTSGLESIRLEKPPNGPNLGTSQERLLDAYTEGGWSASKPVPSSTMAAQYKPPDLSVRSLTTISAFTDAMPKKVHPLIFHRLSRNTTPLSPPFL